MKKGAEINVNILPQKSFHMLAENIPRLSFKAKIMRKIENKDDYVYGLRVLDGELPVEFLVSKDDEEEGVDVEYKK